MHLAATFDYTTGKMALYRNGKPIDGFYTVSGDPWQVDGTGTSATNPRGIKIGGSFPQDGTERNPCNCRMDTLMFLDTAVSKSEVKRQYERFLRQAGLISTATRIGSRPLVGREPIRTFGHRSLVALLSQVRIDPWPERTSYR